MGEDVMDRLTKYSKETTHENGVCCTHFGGMECFARNGDCSRGCTWEEAAWSRLAAYEDTGLTPNDVTDMMAANGNAIYTIAEQKKSLRDLRNELCQLCGKYKQEHEGACDGCRWREK